jgi:protein tyrosine phosphatase (PTP) superfamily phosphohydrolase (DUF442 family)
VKFGWTSWWLGFSLFAGPAYADVERAENVRMTQRILEFAKSQKTPVRQALDALVADSRQLSTHKAHDSLLATVAQIEHRQYLDARVGNFGAVDKKLYRGAQPSRRGLGWLHQQGIVTIVNLREPGVEETNYPDYSRKRYLQQARALGMRCVELPIADKTLPTREQIERFLRTVDDSRGAVFVHCSAGIGRTGILSALYQRHHGASPEQALQQAERFGLQPTRYPDHALQASFLANYPIDHQPPMHLQWHPAPATNACLDALRQNRFYRIRAMLVPTNPTEALRVLTRGLKEGTYVEIALDSPDAVAMLGSLACVYPDSLKLVHTTSDLLPRVRNLLGPKALIAVLRSGKTLEGVESLPTQAQVIDFPYNPPPDYVKLLNQRHLFCTLHYTETQELKPWEGLPCLLRYSGPASASGVDSSL